MLFCSIDLEAYIVTRSPSYKEENIQRIHWSYWKMLKKDKITCMGHISFKDQNNYSEQLAIHSTPKVLLHFFYFILFEHIRSLDLKIN
jgi:hypothetical protein